MRLRLILVTLALGLSACSAHSQSDPAAAPSAAGQDQAAAFLAKNARQPGVIVLPSGLQYKIVRSGPADGQHPSQGDEIKVTYSGSLVSGEVFDSTDKTGQPAVMPLDQLVPGWMEALPKMRPGDEWILYVPPALGYGPEGRPPVIPPNSVLVFDLKLLDVLKMTANG